MNITLFRRLPAPLRRAVAPVTGPTTALVGKATALVLGVSLLAPTADAEAVTRRNAELAFAAAGVDYGYSIDYRDYVRVADRFDIELDARYGYGIDARDLARAADRFGVEVGDTIDGADVDRIVAAVWNGSVERFATAGIGIGDRPDPSDFTDAAAWLGVDYGSELDSADASRVLAAGRSRVARALDVAGIGYGTELDASDVVRAGQRLGVGVGARLDSRDTRNVMDAAWRRASSPVMATTSGIRIFAPSPRPVHVGWHQSSGRSSLPMNARIGAKMPSRGRGTAGTSAVDVAMQPGDAVRAPVTGRVVAVQPYRLYGRYSDYRIRIVPDDNPRMLVTAIHVANPQVRPGQRVQGGADVIAGEARKFPFWSQIDGLGGRGRGHVHVELRPR